MNLMSKRPLLPLIKEKIIHFSITITHFKNTICFKLNAFQAIHFLIQTTLPLPSKPRKLNQVSYNFTSISLLSSILLLTTSEFIKVLKRNPTVGLFYFSTIAITLPSAHKDTLGVLRFLFLILNHYTRKLMMSTLSSTQFFFHIT